MGQTFEDKKTADIRAFHKEVHDKTVDFSKAKPPVYMNNEDKFEIAKTVYQSYRDNVSEFELNAYNPAMVFNQQIRGVLWPRIFMYRKMRQQHGG